MNGKGSAPRNCFSPAYRRNYDDIFRKVKQTHVLPLRTIRKPRSAKQRKPQ